MSPHHKPHNKTLIINHTDITDQLNIGRKKQFSRFVSSELNSINKDEDQEANMLLQSNRLIQSPRLIQNPYSSTSNVITHLNESKKFCMNASTNKDNNNWICE